MFEIIRNASIRGKLVLAMVLFDLVITATYTWRGYDTHSSAIRAGIDRRLLSAAQGIAFALPEGLSQVLMDSAGFPDSTYRELSRNLQRFADVNHVTYLYSFEMKNDSVRFLISSNRDSQLLDGSYVRHLASYPDASDSLLACFAHGGEVFESTRDEYGNWRSALVRKSTSDGRTYVLGADIDIQDIQDRVRKSLFQSLAIGLVGFLVILYASLKLADGITTPIRRLEEQTRKIVAEGFDIEGFDTSILRGIWDRFKDESGRLAFAFLAMLQDLSEHIRQLQIETTRRNKVESEMAMAGEIQKNYLPKAPDPRIGDRILLAADSRPARSAGGDLYDHFMVDDRHLVIAVGDVSDKGMPAALFMAISVTLLREGSYRGLAPDAVVRAANASLFRHNDLCQFLTLFFAVLDLETGDAVFVNAGHNPPFIRRKDGGLEKIKDRHGPAVGVMPDMAYKFGSFHLDRDDTLVMYTDGVTEAFDPEGNLYGDARLENFLSGVDGNREPQDLLDAMWKDVALHVDGAEQSDDITTMVLRCTRTGTYT